MTFPISGVTVSPLIPLITAYVVSTIGSMGGVTGAFILLPFQVSVLGFTSPAVNPTNHLFNVVAIPSGIYRYVHEGRMTWPLAAIIAIGTVPGVILGSLARIYLIPDPRTFKLFIGLVLLYIGSRVIKKILNRKLGDTPEQIGANERVQTVRFDWRRYEYTFQGKPYGVSTLKLSSLTVIIGIVGGAYGVGGGAIIAPVLVSMFGLPVHTIAGATLLGTFLTSFVGVTFFSVFGPLLGQGNLSPDWLLGLLLGLGGLLGVYTGSRLQRYVQAKIIESFLALLINGMAVSYIIGFFWTA